MPHSSQTKSLHVNVLWQRTPKVKCAPKTVLKLQSLMSLRKSITTESCSWPSSTKSSVPRISHATILTQSSSVLRRMFHSTLPNAKSVNVARRSLPDVSSLLHLSPSPLVRLTSSTNSSQPPLTSNSPQPTTHPKCSLVNILTKPPTAQKSRLTSMSPTRMQKLLVGWLKNTKTGNPPKNWLL